MERPCGLLTHQKEPVPLKSISVTLSISEFVAGVSATLNYENEEKVPLEVFFVFPMDDDSAVYSFEAMVDGKKIVAELQEKNKARANYEDAVSQGHQAFLLEEDDSSRDVFCCNLGNLPPGSKATLALKYVQELPLDADGALRYVLPAVLNPRYPLSGGAADSGLTAKTPMAPGEHLPYTLSLEATITSQLGIDRVQCNCPLSATEYLGDRTSAQVSLAEGHKFDRDVELLIHYREVHAPSVAVELGKPAAKPVSLFFSDGLMGDPSAMVSFYPNIPEDQSPITCGEFVFLMDCSGSMGCPMSNQDKSQLRIEAAKETLIWLLKSLPIGCYFNIYEFGSSYEAFFQNSVKYTQDTMEEALRRVKLMQADLWGTEILAPLKNIYSAASIPGHPLQLFVFTDGEVDDTFSVIREVKSNRLRHRCFSFGIGEGASTSLIKGIARVSGGTAEFITGSERMQSKALRALKHSLQPVVEDVSLSWNLPPGLAAKMLSPEPTVIFRGQRLIVYAQLTGKMPPAEATGEVCLKYALQGKSFENKVIFSLQPKFDANFTIHRLAAKSFLQTKDMGVADTPANDKKDVLKVSLECGVISSHTAFIAINKDLNKPVQGPLVRRDIPRSDVVPDSLLQALIRDADRKIAFYDPIAESTSYHCTSYQKNDFSHSSIINRTLGFLGQFKLPDLGFRSKKPRPVSESPLEIGSTDFSTNRTNLETNDTGPANSSAPTYRSAMPRSMRKSLHRTGAVLPMASNLTDSETNHTYDHLVQLISLQNADGSWCLNEGLAVVLGVSLEEILAALPLKGADTSGWATVLAVLWLHGNRADVKCEWELLERKAVAWLHAHAGAHTHALVKAAIDFLKSSVDPAVFAP